MSITEWDDQEFEEAEETNFISMTDMMVGLFLILIILLIYYFLASQQAISDAERVSKTEQAAVVARGIVLNRIRDQLDDDRIEFDTSTGTIRFSDNVLNFASGRFEIPEPSKELLRSLADSLAATVPCLAFLDETEATELECSWVDEDFASQQVFERSLGDLRDYRPVDAPPQVWIDGVFVEGHTDCTRFQSAADPDFSNWVLGGQRAATTHLFLARHNPLLERIFSKNPNDARTAATAFRVMGVASYSDRRPAKEFDSTVYPADPRLAADLEAACGELAALERANPDDPAQQNRRNRRIDIRIVMGWTTQEAMP